MHRIGEQPYHPLETYMQGSLSHGLEGYKAVSTLASLHRHSCTNGERSPVDITKPPPQVAAVMSAEEALPGPQMPVKLMLLRRVFFFHTPEQHIPTKVVV